METVSDHNSIGAENNPFRDAKKKGGEFSIESILLAKDNCQNEDSIQNTFVPPSTQSLKARTKHGLSSSIPNHSNFTGGGNAGSGTGGGKRARTIFTTEQLERMEREFHKQQYVVGHERMYLANALNLTEAQVKVWFQNRRIKWRKQHMLSEQTRLNTLATTTSTTSIGDHSSQMNHDPQAQLDQLN
eukprot:04071.XXX_125462_126080_1 [CDS] Oithona nana genome sequencing.